MGELCEEDSVQFNSDIKVQITGKFDAERDVKFRNINKLCKQEQEFRTKRQAVVFRNMKKKLKMKNLLQVEAAPNIAIIGSGGGMRAVVGMCGAMTALQDEGFLDSAMYTAGLSGSAWYLLTMYAHDKQLNPKAVTDTIRKKLEPFGTIQFWKAWYSWKYFTKSKVFNSGKYFTITDTFGEMIGDLLLEEKCKQKWSNQRKKLEDGSAPLPLIAALHVRNEETIKTYNEWIELSPYEVFMPRYGAAIDMKNFGDRFYGGFITKEYGEQPIHFLQGSVIKRTTNKLFNNFDATFVGKVPNYLHGIPEFTPLVENLVEKTDRIVEPEKKDMMLVDAGIAFNSPYPAVLHPARKVDVILSFDFSDRGEDKKWPFEELEKAKKWADERNVPFPALRLNDIRTKCEKKGDYDEVYIFEGNKQAPTIVHFVMINKSFRKQGKKGGSRVNGQQDFDILPKYSTRKFGYSNEEFDKLKSLVEYNVYNNKKKIVECASLAQDRGRLEAKIESFNSEIVILKKSLNKETDALKIKSKMLEDQTETIRKLKEGLVERDEEIKKAREEALKTQRSLEEQLNEERAGSQDVQERLDTLRERKDDLKHQVADLESELEESKKAHSILNNKWKEKSQLIGQLEKQVQQMKDNWENKEKKLTQERNKAVEAASTAIEKLRSVDDSFRKQLEAKESLHQEEINRLEHEKQAELDQAYQKVYEVEEEMRELLRDQDASKKATEEKVKRLTKALGDLQTDLM
ncbi:leucine-rich repeat and coiled-coil domain-containing protein 1 [Mytilus galloprovincialis]|uniref:Leucine-rich repeat and coiled-coil domain-containing protein 1 n=1 Tax=Mytilus galloprovincialis TaxID=29158 RepID=A0A8B6DZF0_MYTGA|nr:leucine-rich repeat and coiled-coil domain-containing protein 1 [Mytilus galloprovincialis]